MRKPAPEPPAPAASTTQARHRSAQVRPLTILTHTTTAYTSARSRQQTTVPTPSAAANGKSTYLRVPTLKLNYHRQQQTLTPTSTEIEHGQHPLQATPRVHSGCSRQQQQLKTLTVFYTLITLAHVLEQLALYPILSTYADPRPHLHELRLSPAPHAVSSTTSCCRHKPYRSAELPLSQERRTTFDWAPHSPHDNTTPVSDSTGSIHAAQCLGATSHSHRYPLPSHSRISCFHCFVHLTPQYAHTTLIQFQSPQRLSHNHPYNSPLPYKKFPPKLTSTSYERIAKLPCPAAHTPTYLHREDFVQHPYKNCPPKLTSTPYERIAKLSYPAAPTPSYSRREDFAQHPITPLPPFECHTNPPTGIHDPPPHT
jgi:hypothetical protein